MAPSSPSTSQERPQLPPLTRQHSRSSSQLATFASLALSPVSTSNPPLPRPGTPPTNHSPRFGFQSLTVSPRRTPTASRRNSISVSDDSSSSDDDGAEQGRRGRTDSGSTAATSGASASSGAGKAETARESTPGRTPQALKDRRSTFPSIASPLTLPALTSTAPSPVGSPSPAPSSRASSPSSLPPTDPTTPALGSFPSTSTSLAQFIQHKRRQASAPYFAAARERSLFSPGAGFSLGAGPTSAGAGEAGWAGGWGTGVGIGGSASSSAAGSERGDSLPPSRSRSRASSRRGTTTGLLLQTGGLMLGVPGAEVEDPSAGLVVTPTTEEWRHLGEELADLQERQREEKRERRRTAGVAEGKVTALSPVRSMAVEEKGKERAEVEQQEGGQEEEEEEKAKLKSPVKPRWKRWPSLHDDSDEYEEDDDDEEDEEDEFALSLSLSRFSKYKSNHQLPHTPPPGGPPPTSDSGASSPVAERPSIPKSFKSSFSYSSSIGGLNGGFTSHSNTSSISSLHHAPLSTSSSPPRRDSTASSSSATTAAAPGSDPLPQIATFSPSHTSRRSESSIQLPFSSLSSPPTVAGSPSGSPLPSHLAPPHRPALSRGSLSSTTGGLSGTASPSPPLGGGSPTPSSGLSSTPMSPSGSSDRTERESSADTATVNGDDSPAAPSSRRASVPGRIPLPPNVIKSLDAGSGGTAPSSFAPSPAAESADGEVDLPSAAPTPLSGAATPYDGDPFSSLAPSDSAVPPTPSFVPDTPSAPLPSAAPTGPVDLDWTRPLGPVDPRTYSAVTGLRDIGSFVVEGEEAGKGAYGSVRRAREKGRDGKPVGPELIIKYVIKQRILADCWKKHKILGPIPIEVHVLDHLRRVPYVPRPAFNYLRAHPHGRRAFAGVRAQPVRRDSAPRLDLWTGGEDGGMVQTGHPNVSGLLDFFEDNEYYMLVMPQATASPSTAFPSSVLSSTPRHGQDLFDYVDAHPNGLAVPDIQRILRQLTDAIYFLHEHSIVHRDIKDENVVLDAEGTVRLIDFGSAAYVKEGRKFDTFSGTLDFAAPEVLKGARYGGKEQDVWALGVLGYVLVCGECPFWSPDEAMRGLSPDTRAYAALQSRLSSTPASPSSSVPPSSASSSTDSTSASSAPPSMAAAVDLVQRCLEIDPTNRPSADMVCDHVFLAGEGGWSGYRGWENVGAGEKDDEGED
ncbi:hypothetical protein JCM8097_004901 [Rhodosporidiobolus ruineniae]